LQPWHSESWVAVTSLQNIGDNCTEWHGTRSPSHRFIKSINWLTKRVTCCKFPGTGSFLTSSCDYSVVQHISCSHETSTFISITKNVPPSSPSSNYAKSIFNIILPSTSRYPRWFLFNDVSPQAFCASVQSVFFLPSKLANSHVVVDQIMTQC
jgi:hypothetical protein